MTEFQKKTYDKLVKDINTLIPDEIHPEMGEKFTGADFYRCVATQVDKLTEKELDALLTIGPVEGKRVAVTQRMIAVAASGSNKTKED